MMPDTLLQQLDPNDIRFQYEVIKGLADSVRKQTDAIGRMQEQQTEILVRLERIESKNTSEALAALTVRVEKLEADKLRREGASGVVTWIFKSPVFAWIAGIVGIVVIYFEGRGQ